MTTPREDRERAVELRENRGRILHALTTVEELVKDGADKKHQLWRDFAIAATQALRLAVRTWTLENELEDEFPCEDARSKTK